MAKYDKILKVSGITATVVVVLVLLSFVGSIRTSALCDDVLIEVKDSSDVDLVTQKEIRRKVDEISGVLVGTPLNTIDTKEIEEMLEEMPQVKSVKVYKTIDKKLMVSLAQRRPIVRLIDVNGKSMLMGQEGNLIPVTQARPSRLPVVSGDFNIVEIEAGVADSVHLELFAYASAIAADNFWKAQLQHTIYTAVGGFEAFPQVGKHSIVFGDASDIETKLVKLKVFYGEGMTEANWNKYSRINLKYKDQIVCTKK